MFRSILKKLRVDRGLSLREFAKLTKISHTSIARYEKGYHGDDASKKSIDLDDLQQICERTGYSFRRFLEEAGYIEPVKEHHIEVDSPTLNAAQLACVGLDEVAQGLVINYISDIKSKINK